MVTVLGFPSWSQPWVSRYPKRETVRAVMSCTSHLQHSERKLAVLVAKESTNCSVFHEWHPTFPQIPYN